MPTRPIINTFLRTPWIADVSLGHGTVKDVLPRQVQIGFEGTGRMRDRKIVPYTPAAHELLYGHDGPKARHALRGMLGLLDGTEGANNLRGISLADSAEGYVANRMMSMTEAGFLPESNSASIAAGKQQPFFSAFQKVADTSDKVGATNFGVLDMGPDMSRTFRDLIHYGPEQVGNQAVQQFGRQVAHELTHNVTPAPAKFNDDRLDWMEEGAAEALSYMPGTATRTLRALGVPAKRRDELDPYTADNDRVASDTYRMYRRSIGSLLDLAGVRTFQDNGDVDSRGLQRAQQLLQGESMEQVPKNLARAIVKEHHLRPEDVEPLAQMIADTRGNSENVEALREAVTRERFPTF
jgi:hypothetical protein